MHRSHRLNLPNLEGKTCGRRRRELALIFALFFGAGLASAPAPAREVPFSAPQVISTLGNGAFSVFAADIDGDGAFGPQQVISTLADVAISVFAADVDGDGDVDVLSASYTDGKIAWYENTDGAGTFGSQQVISTLADRAWSVFAADVDGDGDFDVLSASAENDKIAWYENTDGAGTFGPQQVISTLAGRPNSVFAADVDGDGDLDVLSASRYDDKIAWYENTDGDGTFGSQQVISTLADKAFWVIGADVDGDGDLDVLSASYDDDKIAWYENTNGDGTFGSQQVISTLADRANWVFAADIDGDGDLDVLSASRYDNKIAWYENTNGAGSFGSQEVISTLADGPFSVVAADVDGDGDLDVLFASFFDDKIAWYENEAIHRSAVFPEQAVISTLADSAYSVIGADVDGDGDVDVLSTSLRDHKIAWYENTDGGGSFGAQQVISTLASGPRSVFAADIDGDGDLDVLSASQADDKIAWYENTDSAGSFSTQQVISTLAGGARSVLAADMDGDGDLDVLSASQADDKIAWYENTDGDGSFGTQQVISTLAGGAWSVFAADVDSDGDVDVLAASVGDGTIALYGNVAGDGSAWSRQTITTTAASPRLAAAADVDGDGDLDVLSASLLDDKVKWYENRGGSFAAEQVISTLADRAYSAFAVDVDGDGDLDVLSASGDDDKIAWYENRGGQFALPTTSLAQGVLANSQEEVLFQIDLEHRGRAGDSAVELATIELRFEDGSGFVLTSTQADALIDKLELFLDDGSGSFEPGSDPLVEVVTAFSSGLQSIPLAIGDPDALVLFGTSKRYFVVITMTSDASAQTPDSFKAIHLTEASSTARDASVSSVPLTLEHEANTTTGLVDTDLTTSTCQAPFELDLQGFTVSTAVACQAGTVLTAANGLQVVSPGDLTLRAGERVVLGVDFSVGSGGKLETAIDPKLQP